jgi:hypothetical protein
MTIVFLITIDILNAIIILNIIYILNTIFPFNISNSSDLLLFISGLGFS